MLGSACFGFLDTFMFWLSPGQSRPSLTGFDVHLAGILIRTERPTGRMPVASWPYMKSLVGVHLQFGHVAKPAKAALR
ncbi:hypothetical protein DPMN_191365 [Dreissena polymorpha]|uniref:Uncharacterized protein n=1 Tax=Dreissena polymorpha TaxID=45954 RepID=A0A9D4BEA7_DREPO|nr:hypothetical protein DPMN_191365 [Dreissena polymorpha]